LDSVAEPVIGKEGARLVVEQGSPFTQGTIIDLNNAKTIIGRSTASFHPDIGFDSLLISRQHCCIERQEQAYLIAELGSKHGTLVNGRRLGAFSRLVLEDNDTIDLADGVIRLRFLVLLDLDNTIDWGTFPPATTFIVDLDKRVLRIHETEIPLAGKEWRLLEVLYHHRNKLVPYEMIRTEVWSERRLIASDIPDVGMDEINVLLHRLRCKLGVYGKFLVTRRGQGCILEV